MKTPSSFETLSQSGLGLLGLLLPVLAVALTLALLAYHYSLVRAIVEQAFGIVHGLWDRLADGFRHLSDAVAISLRNLSRHATRDGKWPLVALAVAVPVLLALFLVMVIYDIRLWGSYFEALFGETIELPLLGEVPGGTLSALFPVSASLLLGALAESLLGLHPLPLADLAGPRLAGGMRAGLAVVAALLWLFLTVTVLDVSNVVYEELGRQVAAQRVAEEFDSDATLAQPGPDLFSLPTAAPAAPVELDARTAAKQQALIEAWNGDGRRRAMFNGLAEVSLQLSIIFSWTIFAALALAGLVGLGLVFLGLRGASALMSLGGWLTRVLYVLVQRLLELLSALGNLLARRFPDGGGGGGGGGNPLPPPPPPPPAGAAGEPGLAGAAAAGGGADSAAGAHRATSPGSNGQAQGAQPAGAGSVGSGTATPPPDGGAPRRPTAPSSPSFDL